MEEWAYVDERELSNCRCSSVCVACQHFRHGVDQHCRTLVGCNIRQKQLQQGQHLIKTCKQGSNVAKHSGLGPGDGLIAWTTCG